MTNQQSHRLAPWLGASLLSLAACGSGAAPDDYRPPIATLRGSGLGLGTNSSNADLRIALVWTSGVTDDGFPRRVSQEATWSRTGPTEFEIAITERPPAELLQGGPIDGRVIAYHDLNHNQKLDFASVTDDAFTDELVAFDADLRVQYNEVDGDGQITINDMDSSTPITLYGSTALALSCNLLDWIPRSAFEAARHSLPHDLDVGPWREELVYNFVACPDDALPATTPPPGTTGLSCGINSAASTFYYAAWTTTTSDFISSTCGPVMRICERTRPAGPPPADWPCPCDPAKYQCGEGNLDI